MSFISEKPINLKSIICVEVKLSEGSLFKFQAQAMMTEFNLFSTSCYICFAVQVSGLWDPHLLRQDLQEVRGSRRERRLHPVGGARRLHHSLQGWAHTASTSLGGIPFKLDKGRQGIIERLHCRPPHYWYLSDKGDADQMRVSGVNKRMFDARWETAYQLPSYFVSYVSV